MPKEKKDTVNTFSKIWVDRNMKLSWICIFLSFGLAYIGRTDIAETLAEQKYQSPGCSF